MKLAQQGNVDTLLVNCHTACEISKNCLFCNGPRLNEKINVILGTRFRKGSLMLRIYQLDLQYMNSLSEKSNENGSLDPIT